MFEEREGWHRHPNGGGWVEDTARVAETAYVGPNARVSGHAKVYGHAHVYDNAQVYGHAEVYGHAWVSGNATVYGNARVYDKAHVSGHALVTDHAKVYGDARVYGEVFSDETSVPSKASLPAKIPKKESSVWVEGVKAGLKNAVLEKVHPALLMATEDGRDELISRGVEGILDRV